MTASVGPHHHHPAAEAVPHIIRRTVAHSELQDPTRDTAAVYSMVNSVLSTVSAEPWVEVTEQPKSTAMRFRYQCEGRSAGTILGLNATIAQKTYPSIRVRAI